MPTKMGNTLAQTYEWFVRAVPRPSDKNFHVQLGVHIEEVTEMIHELHSKDVETATLISAAEKAMGDLASHLKKSEEVICIDDRKAFLDSICDQLVTATGVAWMKDMDPVGGLAEVNRSNWSKFVKGEPVFDPNGKITKGPEYTAPFLDAFF